MTAGGVLTGYLGEHLARLERQHRLMRAGDQEGVHQLRVAARRLRSALTTYAALLEPGSATELRAGFKWLGGVLSEARDAQVLSRRVSDLVAEEPDDLVLGPVLDRLTQELGERFRAGRAEADRALSSERYVRLVETAEAFLEAPPFTEVAAHDACKVVPRLLQAELDRVRDQDRSYRRATTSHGRDLALHDVRKAAKRLRYAAESGEPAFGKRAASLAARAEALQELLGEHQDSVVGRATLRQISARASEAGENGFTFGRLHAVEAFRAQEVERRYPEVLGRLPGRSIEDWLRG